MEVQITITQQDVNDFNFLYLSQHPKSKKIPIKGPQHPSLNEYVIANNMKSNSLKQNWKEFIVFVLERRNLKDMQINTCEVEYVTFFKTQRKHDLDNITPKFIFDGLVEGGFLVGDDMSHITKLTITGGYDKENPRIELFFRHIEKRRTI